MELHFLLTEDDGDIIFWKESLPHFYFSEYVKDILVAENVRNMLFYRYHKNRDLLERE